MTHIHGLTYEELRKHAGHAIVLNDITDWNTNREIGIEIRCENKECEASEPLIEMDAPKS